MFVPLRSFFADGHFGDVQIGMTREEVLVLANVGSNGLLNSIVFPVAKAMPKTRHWLAFRARALLAGAGWTNTYVLFAPRK
jgi:hypothetical protein